MKRTVVAFLSAVLLVAVIGHGLAQESPRPGNANTGAKLVQTNGCSGCHGAKFEGGIGPKLYGIEHKLSRAQIADFIRNPRAPMPNFGFSAAQIDDIVAYISNLDGDQGRAPIVTLNPPAPAGRATITVRFPGKPPKSVLARAIMKMGTGSHHSDTSLHPTKDPHVWQGVVEFSMGGSWTIEVRYANRRLVIPVTVEGGM